VEPRQSEDPLVRRPPARDLSYLFLVVVIVPILSIMALIYVALSGNAGASTLFFSSGKLVVRLAFAMSAALAVASGLVAFTRPVRLQTLVERWGSPTNLGVGFLVYGAGLAGFALLLH
jgi:hypothetical protein